MRLSNCLVLGVAALIRAQFVPPPPPVLLTATKSGVLPVLPTGFTGVYTLQGAIIQQAGVNSSYTPVNGPAGTQNNLPAGTFTAELPDVSFNELAGTVVRGTVIGSANQGDTGVTWSVNLTGLPDLDRYGPFMYHIHDVQVPSDGNCTSTSSHFDYTNAGEYYACDTSQPQKCQIGDLSGKHGLILNTTFTASYVDNYLSTDPTSPYYFGLKSIVIHARNATRLACANFMSTGSNSSETQSPTSTAGATMTSPPSTTAGSVVATESPTQTITTTSSTKTRVVSASTPANYTGAGAKAVAGSAVVGIAALFGLML